jgi:para-aminobenzoate synthetase / 4-amino-4-deoxychorismate lyase
VIEARFDDLTGDEVSFRLVEPVGLFEATRPEEVAGVLDAAEGAVSRGLWVAGFVAYEAAPGLDPALQVRPREADDPFARLPLAWFAMFERREDTVLPEPQGDPESTHPGAWRPSVDRGAYDRAIASIHERIAAGDTYQVNHTLRLRSQVQGDDRGLYRDLCFAQRGAYAGYLNLGRYRVLSASPELFFRRDGDSLITRPMKGTAPRGRWPDEDDAIADALRGSVKDRAENAMIVDLLRNDMGRVARPGTVTWSDVFDLERYETVWQLTSTVSAQARPDVGLADVFRGLFPCGSVTGAPKVQTMRIIAELEDSPRGVYCGAVGYLAPEGSGFPRARFNVPIRTVVVDAETGTAEYGVGGGITWDSRAGNEYDEVVAKAKVLTARRPRFDLVETMRSEPETGLLHLNLHMSRLAGSAGYFGFEFDERALRETLARTVAELGQRPARVRVSLDRRGKATVATGPLPPEAERLRVALDVAEPVDPSDPMLFHKTTLRRRYEEASARHPDADDVLLTNVRGEITESTISNVAMRLNGTWLTPPLDCGLLPGVGRTATIAEGWMREGVIRVDDLARAEAMVLISDVRGRRAIELVA